MNRTGLIQFLGNEEMNSIRVNVKKAFESLEEIESEARVTFSFCGPVVPFLFLSLLQTAINRQVGCPEYSSNLLNISKGLYRPVPVLKLDDTEPVIAAISKEVGDDNNSLKKLFIYCIYAFDDIANSSQKLQARLEGFSELDYEKDSKAIFEEALKAMDIMPLGEKTISNPSLVETAKRILSVKSGEVFSDFVCGLGFSSAVIAGGIPDLEMALSDVDVDSYAFSSAGCFLLGVKNHGCNEDTLSGQYFNKGIKSDKIFIEPPLRVKMEIPFNFNSIKIKEASCSAVMKVTEMLKDGGKAVVVVNTGFTYGTQFDMLDIRRFLVDNKLISSVISLPAMRSGTSNLTTLLVISKEDNEGVTMIDLSRKNNDSNYFTYNRGIQTNALTPDGINSIMTMMEEKKDISGICTMVSYDRIVATNYSLLPSEYFEEVKEKKLSVDEIDSKIKKTLAEIQELAAKLW